MMHKDLEAARAAGFAAGTDHATAGVDCPYSLFNHPAERLLWFSGFSRARRARRRKMLA
jgi:hypothetical protein